MKHSATSCVKGFLAPKLAVKLLLVSLGLTVGAFAQYPGNPDDPDSTLSADLWREWMSVLQREPSQISGPRLYLMTDREVLQTSPTTASFQNGSYRMVLADGSVPDVDGDDDGHTDVVELTHPSGPDWNDPDSVPLEGDPLVEIPPDAFSILIADGSILGIADSTLVTDTRAVSVKPASGSAVRVSAAPYSNFERPVSFRDFSSQFYYYYVVSGQTTGEYRQYPLSLYYLDKDFPNPQNCNALESSVVPGVYRVEFPTIVNAPIGKASIDVAHRLVPNGSLTIGQKKPTWLVRSLKSYEKGITTVEQKWVNGRLKFDPYLPFDITWDNLYNTGLASTADYIEVSFVDEDLGRISYTFRVNAATSSLSLNLSNSMYLIYGTLRERMAGSIIQPAGIAARPLHESIKGNIVMRYLRYANRQVSADLSSVTVRVPIEMYTSYASWRKELFPLYSSSDDSVSGPSADPDGDGLTNQEEFDQGLDPWVATLAVVNPESEDITINSATLSAMIVNDPLTEDNPLAGPAPEIYERGVVYSVSSTNPFPTVDGPGVNRVPSPNTAVVSDASVNLQTVIITVANHKLAVGTSAYANISGLLNTELNEFGELVEAETINGRFLVKSLDSNRLSYTVPGVVGIVENTGELEPTWIVVAVTGLASGTQYSFQGYVMTDVGIFYSSVSSFYTLTPPPVTLPTVTTPTTGSITGNSAVLSGDVTSDGNSPITERGVVYSISSTNDNPFIGGSGVTKKLTTGTTGIFTVNVTALTANTTYSFRAYAINAVGTSHTSAIGTFTTPTAPIVTSPTSANITSTTATLGGNVTSTGGSAILQRGIVFSLTATNANPEMGGTGVTAFAASTTGTGVFTANATNLLPGRGYSYKAYAINSIGRGYTLAGTFTTPGALATISAPTISNVTSTSASLGANVTSDGSSPILERGFVYSVTATDSDPNVGDPTAIKVTALGATDLFSVSITGLASNTGYTFKPYAINSAGTAYGAPYAFFTTFPPLTVSSPTVTDVTATMATLGGTVASDGATTVSERGVVYSIDPNIAPVVDGPGVTKKTATGSMGAFTVGVTGLSPVTDYYFRAFATNTAGTSYSEVSTFKTVPAQLLGLAQMEWVPGPQQPQVQALQLRTFSLEEPQPAQLQTSSVEEPQPTAVVESPQAVPGFVYYKAESERVMIFEIQTSSDNREWLPINQDDWIVTETSTEIRATWGSTVVSPPTRIFFRTGAPIR
jgi:hypothetical protein